MDSAKETAKETLHKVTYPSMDPSKFTQQPANTGLKQDIEPKPQKVHLPSEGEDIMYKPSGKLKGKKALITGGDSGISRTVAILFAIEGATVAIVYLSSEEDDTQHTKAQVEKNSGEIVLIPSDLSLSINCVDVAKRAVNMLGGIDILTSTFCVNLDLYFHLTKYMLPHLSKGSVIINSVSVDSYIGVPSRLDYAMSKGAVVAFIRALSNQLVKKGIRINTVAAGSVWTLLLAISGSKQIQKGHGLRNWMPMDRESAFISRQTLHPNGGIVVNS
ncbi:hypothetical protein F5883DRAFT_571184 [Diaporthe sp. PMI_573]|nr:hypothetical protein F5883DRAFT_571184 [Diaporthaceae sp. PMI_573]